MKPIFNYTKDEVELMQLPFKPSSRVLALEHGTSKSVGASCNVSIVEDDLNAIAYAQAWGTSVLGYQGAPAWDLSKLRPIGSKLGTKGTASGATSFARVFDAIVGEMRREEKKNGAGMVGLDYRHQELRRFLDEPLKHAYKVVYLPMHDTVEAAFLLQDNQSLSLLAEAYNNFKCFLVKRPLPLADGTELAINLCTEVELPNKGFCILGSINLSYFTEANIYWLPAYFRMGMHRMVQYETMARTAAANTQFLQCDNPNNRQVGLGIYGLASVLGAWGIEYKEFNEALVYFGVNSNAHISQTLQQINNCSLDLDRAHTFVKYLVQAYADASIIARDAGLRAAFCIQPTVQQSQRSLDAYGYNVSPEIQPVDAIKHETGVSFIRKSAIKGDSVQVCHPGTWTIDEVPYETYAYTSALMQQLMDSTELSHRHSHCFYGERFTVENLKQFYLGQTRQRKSLYYRLPYTNNTESLRKDELWQDVGEGELYSGDLQSLLSKQKPNTIVCECQD